MSPAFTPRSTMKAKSRDTGWNAERSSSGLARVGFFLASGMQQAGSSRYDLQRLHRRACRREYGERIGLGVERIDHGRARPMPAHAFRGGKAVAHAGGGDELVLGFIALEDLPDLEQRDV